PDVGEVVGPGIHELEHVVAVLGVGYVQHDRALADVALPDQIDGVVVGRHELGLGSDQGAGSGERVVGRMDRERLVLRGYEVPGLLQVVYKRIAVDVDLSGLLDLLGTSHDHAPSLGLRLDALGRAGRDRQDLKLARVVLVHVPAARSWLAACHHPAVERESGHHPQGMMWHLVRTPGLPAPSERHQPALYQPLRPRRQVGSSGCRVGANGFRPAPSPGPTPPPLHPLRVTTHGRPVATMWLDYSSDGHGAG